MTIVWRRLVGRLAPRLFVLAILAGVARADDWPAAEVKEVFSESREWFVRVVPGSSIGDTVGFAGSPKGPYAKAEFYKRQSDRSYRVTKEITLINPVAPVAFLVTDRGYLVTFDNWHNMGYGWVLASYSPRGKLVASYGLRDLFSDEEIRKFERSVSSIWWRDDAVYVRSGQQSVYVAVDEKGAELIFEPEAGGWQFCEWQGNSHYCRTANAGRTWREYREPELRE
jgi:hypothetical protein